MSTTINPISTNTNRPASTTGAVAVAATRTRYPANGPPISSPRADSSCAGSRTRATSLPRASNTCTDRWRMDSSPPNMPGVRGRRSCTTSARCSAMNARGLNHQPPAPMGSPANPRISTAA